MKTFTPVLIIISALFINTTTEAQIVQTYITTVPPISYDGTWSKTTISTGGAAILVPLGEEGWFFRGLLGGGAFLQGNSKPSVPVAQGFGLLGYKLTKEFVFLGGGGMNALFLPTGDTKIVMTGVSGVGWAVNRRLLLAGVMAFTPDGFAPGVQLTINLF